MHQRNSHSTMNRRGVLSLIVACVALPFLQTGSQAQQLQRAPINPGFAQPTQPRMTTAAAGSHGLGFVPSTVDLSHIQGRALFAASVQAALPAKYDLRTLGKLTPVKDQGPDGTCWAFATMGSLESALLPTAAWDFSENNLKNTSGFDLGPSGGGNFQMSAAYLLRGSGPIAEKDDPYKPNNPTSPTGLSPQKYVNNILFLPSRANSQDNTNIKAAVMNYGAVMTSMYYSSDAKCYNATTHAYYYSGTGANHAVDIVGWDDNYLASNFKTVPAGPGAFIVRNSWGTSWGEAGYFYISYYDKIVGSSNAVFYGAISPTQYRQIYQYDPLGWVTNVGYGKTAAYAANVFTANATESVSAVGFYAVSTNVSYTVSIYYAPTNGPLSAGAPVSTMSGALPTAGYYTIPLTSPVTVASGQKFSVVVKLSSPDYAYPVAIEYPYSGYSSKAVASKGQSFLSADGASWSDLTSSYPNSNVCIKALTTVATAPPPPVQTATTLTTSAVTAIPGQTITLTATLKKSADGTAVSGKPVVFAINKIPFTAVNTSSTGVATLSVTLSTSTLVGSYPIAASFAGDTTTLGASASATLTVNAPPKAATILTMANASVVQGASVTLTATLKKSTDGSVLSGRTVTFVVNKVTMGSVTTNASGVASITISVGKTTAVGNYATSASYAGDTSTLSVTASGVLTVATASKK